MNALERIYKVLVIDDDEVDVEAVTRYLTKDFLYTYEFMPCTTVGQGLDAFETFQPDVILCDYRLPDGTGLDYLKALSEKYLPHQYVFILMTRFGNERLIVDTMIGGAANYISKDNMNRETLCQVVNHGIENRLLRQRVYDSEQENVQLIEELRSTLAQLKKLEGLLPVCSHCKSIRDDEGHWERLEEFFTNHSEAVLTHGICPACVEKHYNVT